MRAIEVVVIALAGALIGGCDAHLNSQSTAAANAERPCPMAHAIGEVRIEGATLLARAGEYDLELSGPSCHAAASASAVLVDVVPNACGVEPILLRFQGNDGDLFECAVSGARRTTR